MGVGGEDMRTTKAPRRLDSLLRNALRGRGKVLLQDDEHVEAERRRMLKILSDPIEWFGPDWKNCFRRRLRYPDVSIEEAFSFEELFGPDWRDLV